MYKLVESKETRCLQCGAPIHGRPDKKFCDAVCRNAYHNREAGTQRRYRNFVLESMEVNYAILKETLSEGRRGIALDEAAGRGFNPDVITGFNRKYRKIDYYVFDIAYNRSDSGIVNIRRIGPDVRSFKEIG